MTHVNAFHAAVDEKKANLVQAKAELETAEEALKAHPDYEAPKKAPAEEPAKAPAKKPAKK